VGRRVLVTGLGTFWGGRAAQALEQDEDVEVIVGLDVDEPSVELERTEFVRADEGYSILSRIVKAAHIDTILHTFLIVDTTRTAPRTVHETNVIGTMNLLAAASGTSTVRTLVVKSSTLVYGSNPEDPAWFSEEMRRSRPPRTPVEQELAAIWRELLGVEEVGVHDHFFDLGGDSLIATQLILRTRKIFQVEIPLGELLSASTVAEFAEKIQAAQLAQQDGATNLAAILESLDRLSEEETRKILSVRSMG